MDENDFDLAVVGGGLAGMVAGVRAAELGLRVAVLEKGSEPSYPCNSRWSGGIIHIAYTDPKEPEEALRRAVLYNTRGFTDPALEEVLVREGARAIDWLALQGGRFIRAGKASWQNWMMAPPRPLTAGLDWRGRGPDVLLRLLAERLRQKGGSLRLATRARSLVMKGGVCAGLEAEEGGASRRFEAHAVILADGGFQGDPELLRRHITPFPQMLKQRGAATGTGDGLSMAREAGAATSPLDCFYGHLLCRDAFSNDRVWPYPELDAIASAGIVVDRGGRRILDEGEGGIFMANGIARSPAPLEASVVFDAQIWDGPGRSARIPANPELARAAGTIHRALAIPELARLAGIDGEGLALTLALYNAACEKGDFAALAPSRSSERYWPMPIATPPFFAIPLCAGITYTMGGLKIDAAGRVLREDGQAIPGLYAAGSTTGGIDGGPYAGYVGGLAKAAVFGLRAAEDAASKIRGEKR